MMYVKQYHWHSSASGIDPAITTDRKIFAKCPNPDPIAESRVKKKDLTGQMITKRRFHYGAKIDAPCFMTSRNHTYQSR
jgi:hypothetical protein